MLQKLKEIKPKEIIEGYFGKFFHGRNMTIAFWNVKKTLKYQSIIMFMNNAYM